MKNDIPVLFTSKSECCGCGACLNVCPGNAISMQEDEYGFLFPHINGDMCIGCGQCKRGCSFQKTQLYDDKKDTYAAVARDKKLQKLSASGGIFATLASYVLKNDGYVFGAAFMSDFSVSHICIRTIDDLVKLQGSKYTQSNIGRTYSEAKKYLDDGATVLFSGTPCQIDGLNGFLGKKYDNLITVDIICHGVPNNKMFQEYISVLEKKYNGKAAKFTFRDKTIGWGINGSVEIGGQTYKIWRSTSSYLFYFMNGWIYRENCYSCKYASKNRPADITLGDYWGIEKQHPDYLGKGGFNDSEGISVLIVNNDKGRHFLSDVKDELELKESSFEKAACGNAQLNHPCSQGKREEVLAVYADGGWAALESRFRKKIGWRYYESQIKKIIPAGIKRVLKRYR